MILFYGLLIMIILNIISALGGGMYVSILFKEILIEVCFQMVFEVVLLMHFQQLVNMKLIQKKLKLIFRMFEE